MLNATERPVDGAASVRERNAVLESIELMRQCSIETVPTMIAFLYLCENEGLCITELADLAEMNMAAASRAAAALTGKNNKSGLGEPLAQVNQVGRIRSLSLTAAGQHLRDNIDASIRRATSIKAA